MFKLHPLSTELRARSLRVAVVVVVVIIVILAVALVFLFVLIRLLPSGDIWKFPPIRIVCVGAFWMISAHVQWYASYRLAKAGIPNAPAGKTLRRRARPKEG
jgi:hypothetical protein